MHLHVLIWPSLVTQMQCRRPRFDPWGREYPLEKSMATHSSILPWRIPWTEEPGGLYGPWVAESCIYLHSWATQAHRHTTPDTNATGGLPRWVSGSSLSRGKWNTLLGTGYAWLLPGVVIQCGHQGAPRIHTASTFFAGSVPSQFFLYLQACTFLYSFSPCPCLEPWKQAHVSFPPPS